MRSQLKILHDKPYNRLGLTGIREYDVNQTQSSAPPEPSFSPRSILAASYGNAERLFRVPCCTISPSSPSSPRVSASPLSPCFRA